MPLAGSLRWFDEQRGSCERRWRLLRRRRNHRGRRRRRKRTVGRRGRRGRGGHCCRCRFGCRGRRPARFALRWSARCLNGQPLVHLSVDHSGRRRALQLQKSVFVSRLREGGVPRRVLLGRRLASGDYLGRPLRGRRVVAGSGGSRPSHPPATVTAQHAGVGPGKVRRQQHEAGATTFSERPPNAS